MNTGELSGSSAGWATDDETGDPKTGYSSYFYVGKKIPSKSFLRLKRFMDKKQASQTKG